MKNAYTQTLHTIFNPRSIAVIGASDKVGKWGYRLVERPLNTGFRGAIYPINPNKKEILGLTNYPSVQAIPGDVDLAVITTPAATVPGVLQECAAKGIHGAVVITAGFAETGENGREFQEEVAGRGPGGRHSSGGP